MLFTLGDSSTPFNPNLHKIVIDVQALLAGNDVTSTPPARRQAACRRSTIRNAWPMFNALKIAQATGLPINGGAGQLVFKAVDR